MDIARHFTLAELKHSNTAEAEGIDNEPGPSEVEALRALCAAVLDPLRERLGKAIVVNCAYRGPALNRRVGGVPNSQHLTGQAADIQAPGMPVLDLFKLILQAGLPFDQVIYEARNATSKWVHVSHVDGPNRGEIRVAKFGPDGKPQSYPLVTLEAALAMVEPRTRGSTAVHTYEEGGDEPELPPDDSPRPGPSAAVPSPAPRTSRKPAAKKRVSAPAKAPRKTVSARSATARKSPSRKSPAR